MGITAASPWDAIVEAGARDDDGRLVAHFNQPGQAGVRVDIPPELDQRVSDSLAHVGIERLYSHQADSFYEAIKHDVIVTTGTASGKSLCFNLPVLHTLAQDFTARALYIYPTKALAQDQSRKLGELGLSGSGRGRRAVLRHAIYDGDTPREERRAIREKSNLILTNPDMISQGILPNHKNWANFFANLAWVVVDEAHVYRGVFGSHVANVLRRLRRLANAYGTEPHFILTSATIANPVELAGLLTGLSFTLIDGDGAPHAEREVAMWNPPLLDANTGRRASALSEAAGLLAELMRREVRTICFMKSRRGVELIHRFTTEALRSTPALAEKIMPYRAGYTATQRRDIERRLSDGDLLAVVATNALELGIDIGGLDAAICTTFPGTVSSLKQMWGRAGRSDRGLAVYLAGEDALDQFFCRHPEEFIDRPVEAAILDPHNESIHLRHLQAAAYELPLMERDKAILGEDYELYADQLVAAGMLRKKGVQYIPRGDEFAAANISLRSASVDNFNIVDTSSGELIGTIEAERAFSTVHPGAVYLHMGRSFEIDELDIDGRTVLANPFDGDWYTQPKREIDIFVEETREQREIGDVTLTFGLVSVTEQVIAFQRKSISDHEVIGLEALDLPEQNFLTQAFWYELDNSAAINDFPLDVLQGSLHAAEHAQIAVLPLIAICDRWDIGGLSTAYHHQTGGPTIFIYDGYPGGVGITKRGYDKFERVTADALRLISECPCESGCPSCVQSPKCGNLNDPLHKNGAKELLGRIK